ELAARGGVPLREAVRRHLLECAACVDFGEALRALRRALAVLLSVVPSDRLRAPEADAAAARRADRGAGGSDDIPPGRRMNRTAAGAGAVAVLVAGVIFAAIALHGHAAPAPAAVAPAGGAVVAHGKV